jgi:spore germination cell wall hydrolase CwlJ-like protein
MRFLRIKLILLLAFVTVMTTGFTPKTYDITSDIMEVRYGELTRETQKQIDCLAENIYHEARSESVDGMKAVAFVTLNRTQDDRFPKSICSVVKQKKTGICQFSWFCSPVKVNKDSEGYKGAMDVALYVYANYEKLYDLTKGALYYHADYVNPGWKLKKTTKIGRHIFYKEVI